MPDATSPQAAYPAHKLNDEPAAQGHHDLHEHEGYDVMISLALNLDRLKPETFPITPESKVITVYGGDYRGLIYGAIALAESLGNGTPLTEITIADLPLKDAIAHLFKKH